MKKCFALLLPVILMSLNFIGLILYAQPGWISSPEVKSPVSNALIAQTLGEVFVLSNPMNDPNDLVRYVQAHPGYFEKDGCITRAASDLGNWILNNGIHDFKENCIQQLHNKLMKEGIPVSYANELLFEMKKSSFGCTIIAEELIWLSGILPQLSEGDLTGYLYTGTVLRQKLIKSISLYETMHNSDPEIAELILKDKNCYHQKIGDQVQLLVLISSVIEQGT